VSSSEEREEGDNGGEDIPNPEWQMTIKEIAAKHGDLETLKRYKSVSAIAGGKGIKYPNYLQNYPNNL
jgi:hypothetical protein